MDKIAHPDIGNEVIGSHYYIVYPFVKRPNNVIKGSEGKEFYIRRFDGTLIKSNNIWHQGETQNILENNCQILPISYHC